MLRSESRPTLALPREGIFLSRQTVPSLGRARVGLGWGLGPLRNIS
jgi:hypothetical protein